MDELEMEHRMTDVEARSKSNTHRIDKVKLVVDEIHTMSVTMMKLVEEIKHTNEAVGSLDAKVERIDCRVDAMEREPGKEAVNTKKIIIEKSVRGCSGLFISRIVLGSSTGILRKEKKICLRTVY